MQPNTSTVVIGNLCWYLAISIWTVPVVAQAADISMSASPEKSTITAGEPLFIRLTFENISLARLSYRADADVFSRVTIGPQGSRAQWVPPQPSGDWVSFSKELPAGSKDSIVLVATEAAGLRVPGEYHMSIDHKELGVSCKLSFIVHQYEDARVRARAHEISEIAADIRNGDAALNEVALTAFDPAISRDLLCSVVQRNPDAGLIVRRLEELADATSIGCLVTVLPRSHGLQREVIVGALKRLMPKTGDTSLRDKIGRALQDQ